MHRRLVLLLSIVVVLFCTTLFDIYSVAQNNYYQGIDNIIYKGSYTFVEWQKIDKVTLSDYQRRIKKGDTQVIFRLVNEIGDILHAINIFNNYYIKIGNVKIFSPYITGNLQVLYNAYYNRLRLIDLFNQRRVDDFDYDDTVFYVEFSPVRRIKSIMPKAEWYLNYITNIQVFKHVNVNASLNVYVSPYTLFDNSVQVFGIASDCITVPNLSKYIVVAFNSKDDNDNVVLLTQNIFDAILPKDTYWYEKRRKNIVLHEIGHIVYNAISNNIEYNWFTNIMSDSESFAQDFATTMLINLYKKPNIQFTFNIATQPIINCDVFLNNTVIRIPYGQVFKIYTTQQTIRLRVYKLTEVNKAILLIDGQQYSYQDSYENLIIGLKDGANTIQLLLFYNNKWWKVWDIEVNKL